MSLPLENSEPTQPAQTRWLNVTCLLAAAVCLGIAINERDGEYDPKALGLITASLAFCAIGILTPSARDRGFGRAVIRVTALTAAVASALVVLRSTPSGWFFWSNDIDLNAWPTRSFYYFAMAIAYAVAAILVVALYAGWARTWRIALPVALLLQVLIGVWMIRAASSPKIDVHLFQQEAAKALLNGRNPYAITFDDMYRSTAPGERPVYGQGLVRDGKLIFGFPYPPLSLYLSSAGHVLTGDYRYAQLLAITLAGALLAFVRPGTWAALMAVLFLLSPRSFFVLGRGWTEPFVVLFLAATVFCVVRVRVRRLLPVALGLLLASKQYMVLVVPLVPLLMDQPFQWRAYLWLLAKAGVVAFVVTVPFAVWDWNSFCHSLVTVQKVAPFREDALSYLVWFYHKTGIKVGVIPAFVAAAIATALTLWRCERSPFGFASAVALVYLVFIALNKQAFANYYYFVIGAMWCALASVGAEHTKMASKLAG